MLNIFLGKTTSPNYRLVAPSDGKLETITVLEEVGCAEGNQWLSLVLIQV